MTRRQLPSRELVGKLGAVPTVAADFNAIDTWVNEIYVANTTAGALTLLIKDKQGTPQTLIPTVSVPANTAVLFLFGDSCQYMPGGINWVASGAGLTASIFGYTIN